MTDTRQRPGDGHQGAATDRGRSTAETSAQGRLDDPELLAEVWRVVDAAVAPPCRRGRIPGVGTPAWWAAPDDVKVAGVLVLAEAWVIHDPKQAVRQGLRELSGDLAGATDWSRIAREHVPHTELDCRRAELLGSSRSFDAAAAARWVETGSSDGSGSAAAS